MSDLQAEFEVYVKKGNACAPTVATGRNPVEKLMTMYALYKQATAGKAPTDDLDQLKGQKRDRREYWIRLGDMDKETAMREYIAHVKKISGESDGDSSSSKKDTAASASARPDPTVNDADLEARFEEASGLMKTEGTAYSTLRNGANILLTGYGLFKQVTAGDAPNDGTIDTLKGTKKAQRESWEKHRGLGRKEAMVEYIKHITLAHAQLTGGSDAPKKVGRFATDFTYKADSGVSYSMHYILADDGSDEWFNVAISKGLKMMGEKVETLKELPSDSPLQRDGALYYIVTEKTDVAAVKTIAEACAKAGCSFHLVVGEQSLGVLESIDSHEVFPETVDMGVRDTKYTEGLGAKSYGAEKAVLSVDGLRYRIYRLGLVLCDRKGNMYPGNSARSLFHFVDYYRELLGAGTTVPLPVDGTMYPMTIEYATAQLVVLSHASNLDSQAMHVNPIEEDSGVKISDFLTAVSVAGKGPVFSPKAYQAMELNYDLESSMVPYHQVLEIGDPRIVLNSVFGILREHGVMYAGPKSEVQVRNANTAVVISAVCQFAGARPQDLGLKPFDVSRVADGLWSSFWNSDSMANGKMSDILPDYVADRVCIVTGASAGIGRELSLTLAKAKALVVVCARSVDKLEDLEKEMIQVNGNDPDRVLVVKCDVTQEEDCNNVIKATIDKYGTIHMLFNNAGRSIMRPVKDQVDRFHDFERLMAVNYYGPVRLTLQALPHMRKQRFGAIINVNSESAETAPKGFGAYAASKSALEMFSNSVSAETAFENILISDVHLPLVDTNMVGNQVMKFSTAWPGVDVLQPKEAVEWTLSLLVSGFRRRSSPTGQKARFISNILPRLNEAMQITMNPF
eukprot:Clim_evm10s168 gene=Clim_evmTU10s168